MTPKFGSYNHEVSVMVWNCQLLNLVLELNLVIYEKETFHGSLLASRWLE
jgi:hypothetical protein